MIFCPYELFLLSLWGLLSISADNLPSTNLDILLAATAKISARSSDSTPATGGATLTPRGSRFDARVDVRETVDIFDVLCDCSRVDSSVSLELWPDAMPIWYPIDEAEIEGCNDRLDDFAV